MYLNENMYSKKLNLFSQHRQLLQMVKRLLIINIIIRMTIISGKQNLIGDFMDVVNIDDNEKRELNAVEKITD